MNTQPRPHLRILQKFIPSRGSFSGEVAQSFAVNLTIAALNIGSGVLLARLLGAAGRGELAAAQALPAMLCMVGQLGLPQAVIYYGAREREQVGRYARSATLLMLSVGVVLMALVAAITPWFLSEQRDEVVVLGQFYTLLLIPTAIQLLPISAARALHRISLWNRLRLISPLLWVVVIAALFVMSLPRAELVLFVYLGLYVLASLCMVLAARSTISGGEGSLTSHWPKMLRYGLPLTLGAAPLALNQSLDRLIIAGMLPATELGLYTVAVSWTRLGQLPVTALTGVAFSKLAGIKERGEQLRFIKRAAVATVLVSAAAAAVLALATPWAVPFAFGEEFEGAIILSLIALISTFLRGIDHILKVSMQGLGRTMAITYAEWAGLAVLVPSAVWLIRRHGVVGAPWALVLGSMAVVLVMSVALWREMRRPE